MSLILKALRKHRREKLAAAVPEAFTDALGGDEITPKTVLPRNAGRRWISALGVIGLLLAVACIAAVALLWMPNRPNWLSRLVSSAGPTAAPATTSATAQALSSTPYPPMREAVKLRTQPLLRTPAPIELPATSLPATTVASPKTSAKKKDSAAAAKNPVSKKVSSAKKVTERDIHELLRLSGIMLIPPPPTALINDEMVRVGDTIEGAKVLAIDNPISVRVEYRGWEYELTLK